MDSLLEFNNNMTINLLRGYSCENCGFSVCNDCGKDRREFGVCMEWIFEDPIQVLKRKRIKEQLKNRSKNRF